MRHYATNLAESVVLFGLPSDAFQREIAERIVWVIEFTSLQQQQFWTDTIKDFIFSEGGIQRGSAKICSARLAPSEFRSVIAVRVWYQAIRNDIRFKSREFRTRKGDCVIANLNCERVVSFIDAHHWAE
jgi:hypothetical protein